MTITISPSANETLSVASTTEIQKNSSFQHVLDSPLTPWDVVPFEDFASGNNDHKTKLEFKETVKEVAKHLGKPEGMVVLGGAFVGCTTWASVSFASQCQALQYGTGVFEASAMSYYLIQGPDAINVLNYLTPRDLAKTPIGGTAFVIFTTPSGTVDDEAVVIRIGQDEFLLSCGGCKDLSFAKDALDLYPEATMTLADYVSFNLKGPERLNSMLRLISSDDKDKVAGLTECSFVSVHPLWNPDVNVLVLRSKIGVEMWGAPSTILQAWNVMLRDRTSFVPCGWNVLNTYRIDCPDILFTLFPLDIHQGTNLYEIRCGYMIDKSKKNIWVGRSSLLEGKKRIAVKLVKLIAIRTDCKNACVGSPIYSAQGQLVGTTTSGALSLKHLKPVAFAHITADALLQSAHQKFFVGLQKDEWELLPF